MSMLFFCPVKLGILLSAWHLVDQYPSRGSTISEFVSDLICGASSLAFTAGSQGTPSQGSVQAGEKLGQRPALLCL